MSKRKEPNTKWIGVVCGCLCLLAVGAGVVWQAVDYKDTLPQMAEEGEGDQIQPVTISQTPKVDESLLKKEETTADGNKADAIVTAAKQPAPQKKAEPVFAYPVQGEVVLPYSVDSAIYDPTLEQYRTNEAISLSASDGTAVKAAESGTVKEITKNEVSGNSLVLQHDNGWLTTYSQLAENIPVKEGETVEKGQTVGVVGKPTKYSVALGEHVDFAVIQNGETKDPTKTVKE